MSHEPSLPVCPEPRGCRADGVPEDCEWCHRLDLESELSVPERQGEVVALRRKLDTARRRLAGEQKAVVRMKRERDELRAELRFALEQNDYRDGDKDPGLEDLMKREGIHR